MNPKFADWMKKTQTDCELVLTEFFEQLQKSTPERLISAMQYSTLGGGKRIRAMLLKAASELSPAHPNAVKQGMIAVEIAHAGSLIHDDLPAMDDDDLRRGKPSCHIQFDEATAILAGDSLQLLALEVLTLNNELTEKNQLDSVKTLVKATGCQGMMGGQQIDLLETKKNLDLKMLENMHRMKTGALIEASLILGLFTAKKESENHKIAIKKYAHAIGLAFQVVDDILDASSDSETLGKTAGKDQQAEKSTFVSLLGVEKAQLYAENLISQAIDSLSEFKENADNLRELAKFVLKRNY